MRRDFTSELHASVYMSACLLVCVNCITFHSIFHQRAEARLRRRARSSNLATGCQNQSVQTGFELGISERRLPRSIINNVDSTRCKISRFQKCLRIRQSHQSYICKKSKQSALKTKKMESHLFADLLRSLACFNCLFPSSTVALCPMASSKSLSVISACSPRC